MVKGDCRADTASVATQCDEQAGQWSSDKCIRAGGSNLQTLTCHLMHPPHAGSQNHLHRLASNKQHTHSTHQDAPPLSQHAVQEPPETSPYVAGKIEP